MEAGCNKRSSSVQSGVCTRGAAVQYAAGVCTREAVVFKLEYASIFKLEFAQEETQYSS